MSQIFIKIAQPTIFALLLMGLGGFSASANINAIPALRSGAQVCDINPDTRKRSVYLPPIWHQVTETTVTQEASTELVYKSAVFNRDGTLAEKAWVSERTIPNSVNSVTRWVILAPEQIGEITAEGGLLSAAGNPIDEAFYLKLLKRRSTFRVEDNLEYWDVIFGIYMDSLKTSHDQVMGNLRRDGHFLTVPRVVAPDLSFVRDLSYLKVDVDMPVSILVEPAEIKYPSEQEVVDSWEDFATRYIRNNHKSYTCAGSKLVAKDLGPDTYPKKTYEDIGMKTPQFDAWTKVRYFNIFGTEIE